MYLFNRLDTILYGFTIKNCWQWQYLLWTEIFIFQRWVRRLMRTCALLSLTSVSCNTPKTFEKFHFMQLTTFCVDISVTMLFTSEMIAKMHIRGILKVVKTAMLLYCWHFSKNKTFLRGIVHISKIIGANLMPAWCFFCGFL